MRRVLHLQPVLVCSLALLLVSASIAQESADPTASAAPTDVNELPVPLRTKLDGVPLSHRLHGVRLDEHGRLSGMTTTIDPNSLELVPEPFIEVAFVQQGRIVAQSRSDANGDFVVQKLTPQAVYSVIARSANQSSNGWYSAFSVAILPTASEQIAALKRNEPKFASLLKRIDNPDSIESQLTLSAISSQDLAAVGLPRTFYDASLLFSGSPVLGGGGASTTSSTSGTGTGAGAVAGTAAAAAASAAATSTQSSTEFRP